MGFLRAEVIAAFLRVGGGFVIAWGIVGFVMVTQPIFPTDDPVQMAAQVDRRHSGNAATCLMLAAGITSIAVGTAMRRRLTP